TATRTVNVIEASSTADVIPPVITITGGTPVTITVGMSYVDQGATAMDETDGTTTAIVISNDVNQNVPGTYSVVYSATDIAGNNSTATRQVIVVNPIADTIAPVITILGGTPTTVLLNSTYTDQGATAMDNVDGDITGSIASTSDVNTSATGTYSVVYTVADSAGNNATATRSVIVIETDTIAPIITINGANPMNIVRTLPYTELNATAMDNVDGSVTVNISGTVDTSTLGTYLVTYTASDLSGNSASAVRVVNVINDTVAPVIIVTGANPVNVVVGTNYVDLGATATDNIDGNLTSSIVTVNPVSSSSPLGTYSVIYTVTDSSGNSAGAARTVNVVPPDTTAPVITMNGSNPVTLVSGMTYIDAGATAMDNFDGDITANISVLNFVNNMSVGTYSVIYSVSDAAGNTASSTRTVNVVAIADTIAPTITINGANPASVTVNHAYTDAGATATDNIDGDITANINVTSNVNTAVIGSYSVTYSVTDGAGNSTSTSRTVNVVSGGINNGGGNTSSSGGLGGQTIAYYPPTAPVNNNQNPTTAPENNVPVVVQEPEVVVAPVVAPVVETTTVTNPETTTVSPSESTMEGGVTIPYGIGFVASTTASTSETAEIASTTATTTNGFVATVLESISNMPRSLMIVIGLAILAAIGWFIYNKKRVEEVIEEEIEEII
ncbi:MAG: DUF5011 domain-containing protein, partial [archaeon]